MGKDDWVNLAKWANNNKDDVYQDRFMWMIQLPRIFHIHKKYGKVNNFKEMLQNIFKPLFEATLDPNGEADPDNKIIADFLLKIVAFDSVDNENKPDKLVTRKRLPKDWTKQDPPPYSYYAYYFWANLYQLNALRATLGLNTFKTRPHCGESGASHHLATMFLLADGINHGIKLALEPSIQYLYYLTQIGISVSPLSNNALFKKIEDNPFYNFLERGLNVTLSTDDPLQFHTGNTSNALMEEYVVAKSRWSLTNTDLAEITRNSILQSGFSHKKKQEYIGNQYRIGGVVGNEEGKTGIPKCRSAFRQEALLTELHDIYNATVRPFDGNKDTKGKAVEVQMANGKWVEAEIDVVPSLRVGNDRFWKNGIRVRYSTLWCLKCAISYNRAEIPQEKDTCSGSKKRPDCRDTLVQTSYIRDEKKIRFRDRIVPKANTPWKWESGDPVTWKDLAAERLPKDSSTRKRLPTLPRIRDTPATPPSKKKTPEKRAEFEHVSRHKNGYDKSGPHDIAGYHRGTKYQTPGGKTKRTQPKPPTSGRKQPRTAQDTARDTLRKLKRVPRKNKPKNRSRNKVRTNRAG